MTAETRCGWVEFIECSKLLYRERFLIGLKGAVYKSYVSPAILCGSETLCLRGIL